MTDEAARERFGALVDQVDAAYAEMWALSWDALGNAFRVQVAERLEIQERLNRGLMYRVFGQIADPPDGVFVATVKDALWARLRITPAEITRRMKMAARIRPRRQLAGPPIAAELALVAAAVEDGVLGEDHLRVIGKALDKLPSCVSATDREDVEASLVREAAKSRAHCRRAHLSWRECKVHLRSWAAPRCISTSWTLT